MNKRIQELSEQANAWRPGGYPSGEGGDKAWKDVVIFQKEEDLQKCAELIVQDCISQIAMIGVSNCDDPDVVWTVDKAIQNIKQHFGVEE